jgi:hypothetical protein
MNTPRGGAYRHRIDLQCGTRIFPQAPLFKGTVRRYLKGEVIGLCQSIKVPLRISRWTVFKCYAFDDFTFFKYSSASGFVKNGLFY